jgi:hypothetical protein
MSDGLDDALAQLKTAAVDRDLNGLEFEVAARIASQRAANIALQRLTPVRVGAICLALAFGVAAGATTAAAGSQNQPVASLSIPTRLAAANLLDLTR